MNDRNNDGVIDGTVLESLVELGGPDLLKELIELFCTDAPSQMADLADAVSQGDASRVASVAHSLKSSCANLGAMRLAELTKELETAGRSGAIESAAEVIEVSKTELDRVTEALRTHVD